MPSSNRYPKQNLDRGGSRPSQPTRRPLKAYRPTRPFEWSPPAKEPGKFPGLPRPTKPFGTRVPLPLSAPTVLPRIAMPLGRMAFRLVPWIGYGLIAWDLWNLYQSWQPAQADQCPRGPKPGYPQYRGYMSRDTCFADGVVINQLQPAWTPVNSSFIVAQPRNYPSNTVLESLSVTANIPASSPHPVNSPVGPVVIRPSLPPQPMFPVLPWVPIAVPPLSPAPLPIPRPPWVPEMPNPEAPPGPVTIPNPVPGKPPIVVNPLPGGNPNTGNLPDPSVIPGIPVLPRPFPARRPGRGVKERKMSGSSAQRRFLGMLMSGASEGFDLLDALHDALPENLQGKDHPKAKFNALYKSWDKVDMLEAFENIWKNYREDKVYGEAFGKMQKEFSKLGFDFPSPRNIGGIFNHLS